MSLCVDCGKTLASGFADISIHNTNVMNGMHANAASSFWTQQHVQDVALVIQNRLAVLYKGAVIGTSEQRPSLEHVLTVRS
ncbi:hypothetical protein FS837_005539 [Tulasnella sp. UAMH 9824]|nr:hypothetical protein FS837_005539 [Tulasnella sp. UAMH 9824]